MENGKLERQTIIKPIATKNKKQKRKEMSHAKLDAVVVKETKREGGVRQSLTECNGAQRRWRGGVRLQSSMAVVV